jgi:hypothetical protein
MNNVAMDIVIPFQSPRPSKKSLGEKELSL